MRIILTIIIFTLFAGYSDAQRDSVFKAHDFDNAKISYRLSSMPAAVIKDMKENSDFSIADSGQMYNATDVITPGLPGKIIVFFISIPRYYILFYNVGGFASRQYCLVFKRKGDKIITVSRLRMNKYCGTYNCLGNALLRNEYQSQSVKFGYW